VENTSPISDDDSAALNGKQVCFKVHQNPRFEHWYVDSGATCHMTNSKKYFDSFDSNKKENIYIADGGSLKAEGMGNIWINCISEEGAAKQILIRDVRYVPDLDGSLLSVQILTKLGFTVSFKEDKCKIAKDGIVWATANTKGHLYKLNCKQRALKTDSGFMTNINCVHAWHSRMGHRNPDAVKMLEEKQLATGIKIEEASTEREKRFYFIIAISFALGVLGLFKYYNFFAYRSSRNILQVQEYIILYAGEAHKQQGLHFLCFQKPMIHIFSNTPLFFFQKCRSMPFVLFLFLLIPPAWKDQVPMR